MITTRTLHQHTAQEVFDFVCTKVIQQGRPSVRPDGSGCAYRGQYGAKCAVGHLITDEDYPAVCVSLGEIGQLPSFCADVFRRLGWEHDESGQRPHRDLLTELQSNHDDAPDYVYDNYRFVGNFKRAARRTANRFGLSAAVLSQSNTGNDA